jgi:triosephosphate isomerase (TIM)
LKLSEDAAIGWQSFRFKNRDKNMKLRPFIVGNWKMHGLHSALVELVAIEALAAHYPAVDVGICPPATLIGPASHAAPKLSIGAQDCHWNEKGAHTGCLSAAMILEAGASMVILGHSERRADNHETSLEIAKKLSTAQTVGLIPILCIGETEAERDAGHATEVVLTQLKASIPDDAKAANLAVAYEPVWAIGTGRTPSVDDVAEMHAAIRASLVERFGAAGLDIRILYGGSVKPSNAAELLDVDNVNGALVGGASLAATDFGPIIAAAAALS